MLSAEDVHSQIKEREKLARDALSRLNVDGYKPSLGKHQAVHPEQIRQVFETAKTECPDAAAVISWLLWHRVLNYQTLAFLADPESKY